MAVSKSARLFVERAGIRPTYRRPVPTIAPGYSSIHSTDLTLSLPPSEFVFDGDPPPDRGQTPEPWPHGDTAR